MFEEIVKQGMKDSFIEAMINWQVEEVEFFFRQRIDLTTKLVVEAMNVKVDYLTVAFIMAFVDASHEDRYLFFRRLLEEGANPYSSLDIAGKSLPLIFLLIWMDAVEPLEILLKHNVRVNKVSTEGGTLFDILTAFEDEFGCEIDVSSLQQLMPRYVCDALDQCFTV